MNKVMEESANLPRQERIQWALHAHWWHDLQTLPLSIEGAVAHFMRPGHHEDQLAAQLTEWHVSDLTEEEVRAAVKALVDNKITEPTMLTDWKTGAPRYAPDPDAESRPWLDARDKLREWTGQAPPTVKISPSCVIPWQGEKHEKK